MKTLAVDIGGSGIKSMCLDENGQPIGERSRILTPKPASPPAVIGVIQSLARQAQAFDRMSVGFPGVVVDGVVYSAPNLGEGWVAFDLASALSEFAHRPVRVANDADIQGLGVVEGVGVELVLTLGTGMGASLFVDGRLVPNLELGHHPFRKGQTYEEQLGQAALDAAGKRRWNRRLHKAIVLLARIFSVRQIYLGGGNAKKINFELPNNVVKVKNVAGLLGGIRLWTR